MHKKVRVVIADDHTIIRDGLRSMISSAKYFEIVGEAENGRRAMGGPNREYLAAVRPATTWWTNLEFKLRRNPL